MFLPLEDVTKLLTLRTVRLLNPLQTIPTVRLLQQPLRLSGHIKQNLSISLLSDRRPEKK